MNSSKDKADEYIQSTQPEVHYNGASGLEVVPPQDPEAYAYDKPQAEEKVHYTQSKVPDRRRVCGVAPFIFWILIFILVALLAAGLGAGLGVGLSKKNISNSTANITPNATLPSTIPHPKTASRTTDPTVPAAAAHATSTSSPSTSFDVSCPANNSLVYTPPAHTSSSTSYNINATTLTYTIHCNQTYYASADITDLQYIPGSNLSSCIQACSVYNTRVPAGGGDNGFYGLCSGLTVTGDEVCELKTGVLNDAAGANRTGGVGQSAKLLWYTDV